VVPRASSDGLRAAFSFPQDSISTARWALHWLLFGLTLVSTTIVGAVFSRSFETNQPLDLDQYVNVFSALQARPMLLVDGLAFSLTLMTILLAHELGHYFACRYYGIDASLPYFLPFPSPIGTLGAFTAGTLRCRHRRAARRLHRAGAGARDRRRKVQDDSGVR
jgi:Zn-dependent protease